MAYRIRRRGADRRFAASAIAAGAILALAVHHGSAPAKGSGAAGAALSVPGGGTLSCSGLEALWESAGGSSGAAFTAAEIAKAESIGRQYATDNNSNGTTDRGYWQINSIHGGLSTYDAEGNARAAVQLSGNGTNWSPWVTYQTGAYQGKC